MLSHHVFEKNIDRVSFPDYTYTIARRGVCSMQDRIKELRKYKGMTQSEFGECIGVRGNTITTYENGTRTPSEAVLLSICRVFGVNETWLRTGEGEMFKPRSRNEELYEFLHKVENSEPGSIQAQLLTVMARLTDEQWEVLDQVAREFVEETKKAGSQ